MDLDCFDWQVIGQLVSAVWSFALAVAMTALLGFARLVFRRGDLLGKAGRQHQVGDLAERHLHLVGVDALALVLRA
jgi:hypothetical protein